MPRFVDSIVDIETLRARRVASGLTQEQLAQHIGVSQGAVAGWERGTRTPTPGRLRLIARTLEVPVGHLLKKQPHDEQSDELLSQRREALGQSLDDAADRLGISVEIFTRVENGQLLPQLAAIDSWAATYQLSVSDFRATWIRSATTWDRTP